MAKFPLDLNENVILVEGLVAGPRDSRIIKMILDTGASLTTVSYQIALAIGVDPVKSKRRIEIITASATEIVPVIILPKFSLLGFTLNNVTAICLNLPAYSRAQSLLGLNILKEFDILLKFRSSKTLELRR